MRILTFIVTYVASSLSLISFEQQAIRVSLDIPKAGAYFILFRYALDQSGSATGEVTLTPKDGKGNKQSSKLEFKPSQAPGFLIVGGEAQPVQFMLTGGRWEVQLVMRPSKLLLVRGLYTLYKHPA